jgi:hypothetical protein
MVNARTATAADFDRAAQIHANSSWFWGIVTAVVVYFFYWWAIIPGVLALLSIVKSVSSTKCAIALCNGTYSTPHPNNGAPDGDAMNNKEMNPNHSKEVDDAIAKLMLAESYGFEDERTLSVPKPVIWEELESRARNAASSQNQRALAISIGGLLTLCWYQCMDGAKPSGLTPDVNADIMKMFDSGDGKDAAAAILNAIGGNEGDLSPRRENDEMRVDSLLAELVPDPEFFKNQIPAIVLNADENMPEFHRMDKTDRFAKGVEILLDEVCSVSTASSAFAGANSSSQTDSDLAFMSLSAIVFLVLDENECHDDEDIEKVLAFTINKYTAVSEKESVPIASKYLSRLRDEKDELASWALWKFRGPITRIHHPNSETVKAGINDLECSLMALQLLSKVKTNAEATDTE